MRILAGLVLAFGLSLGAASAVAMPVAPVAGEPAPTARVLKAAYYCSPGYELTAGDRCIATPARSEVDLYLDLPRYEGEVVRLHPYRHHHRRRGLREKF